MFIFVLFVAVWFVRDAIVATITQKMTDNNCRDPFFQFFLPQNVSSIEYMFHPAAVKMKPCNLGARCVRPLHECAFFHSETKDEEQAVAQQVFELWASRHQKRLSQFPPETVILRCLKDRTVGTVLRTIGSGTIGTKPNAEAVGPARPLPPSYKDEADGSNATWRYFAPNPALLQSDVLAMPTSVLEQADELSLKEPWGRQRVVLRYYLVNTLGHLLRERKVLELQKNIGTLQKGWLIWNTGLMSKNFQPLFCVMKTDLKTKSGWVLETITGDVREWDLKHEPARADYYSATGFHRSVVDPSSNLLPILNDVPNLIRTAVARAIEMVRCYPRMAIPAYSNNELQVLIPVPGQHQALVIHKALDNSWVVRGIIDGVEACCRARLLQPLDQNWMLDMLDQ